MTGERYLVGCGILRKEIRFLLEKNGWQLAEIDFLYSLPIVYKASWKKKFLNFVYWLLSKFTTKFMENMVITAKIVNKR